MLHFKGKYCGILVYVVVQEAYGTVQAQVQNCIIFKIGVSKLEFSFDT